ncbi:hypothetical protein U27_06575 [Candidatus Vecturithrix granuli]|uniref:Uncharacterized protein n=1 Tax=Vecturithrix granuli TaxID=1499967 RepID=A0A081C4T5_VECG1|nr:hypothetical protein U27_06575 [Candidatus Vecturithrix granuli]
MKARLTLKPYQRGAKKLSRQYGDRLLYVRYRYDPVRKKRITTVELIVEEVNWNPQATFAANQRVHLRVEVTERDVQKQVKQAGGTWNQQRKVWELRYDAVLALGLTDRIVGEVGASS